MDSKNTACHSDLQSDPTHFRQCGLVPHGMACTVLVCSEPTLRWRHLLQWTHTTQSHQHLILNQLSDSACSETYHYQISHDLHTELCDPDEIMTHSLRNFDLNRAARWFWLIAFFIHGVVFERCPISLILHESCD